MNFEPTITDALKALGQTNFVCSGEPTNQEEFVQMFAPVTGEDEYGSAIFETDSSEWGVTWTQVKAKFDELVAAHPSNLLRIERNKRLTKTDWWELPSQAPMSDARTVYRQALRDITDTYTSLEDVVWPTKPE